MDSEDPIKRFVASWAKASKAAPFDANACVLATVDREGQPSARTLLLKQADENGLVFFSNRSSRKGEELAACPRAALCIYWPWTGEQYRFAGAVQAIADAESDAYFASRPRDSQLGAWASRQSQTLSGPAELEQAVQRMRQRFADQTIPRPPWWGGYRLRPQRIEAWLDKPFRLHHRQLFERAEGEESWRCRWLYP